MEILNLLKKLGFSEKEISVYTTLLNNGPSSVREIATKSKVNRGTTYDILKSLINKGLVSYYHKEKNQYFLAEDPDKLKGLLADKISILNKSQVQLDELLPELKSIYNQPQKKPVVKYYEGSQGIKTILMDVLDVMATQTNKLYYVYSASDVRKHLYKDFPNFAKERIKSKIKCQVIAVGSGGELWGMDERKWISRSEGSPTYMIIYAGRMAMISLNEDKKPMGLIITDNGIFQTNKMIFEYIWKILK
ncbi:MAG: helix-turn-helix domain-containing protein [bacterium]|nr:helix-turn-helix domain-containing protein [bacterium]